MALLGAGAAVLAASLTWWRQSHVDALSGSLTTSATGGQSDALLVPVAVLAVAGIGAALATTGVLRRSVGAVLLVGGVLAAVLAVTGALTPPAALRSSLPRPPESSGAAQLQVPGPVLAVLGGLLVALVGVLLLAAFGARRALGARYDAPTGRRAAARAPLVDPGADPATDPEASASWWKALDAGGDPTAATSPTATAPATTAPPTIATISPAPTSAATTSPAPPTAPTTANTPSAVLPDEPVRDPGQAQAPAQRPAPRAGKAGPVGRDVSGDVGGGV